MARMLCVTVALCVIAAGVDASLAAAGGSIESRFALFKLQYGRKYATPEEEAHRFATFAANMERARELQLRNPKATFGENDFADMTPEEFKAYRNGAAAGKSAAAVNVTAPAYTKTQVAEAPKKIDWRERGAVTPVKNQGRCGSCWAFSTTGNIEGQWKLAGHDLKSLSEQELVSCNHLSNGCNGGHTGSSMDWLVWTQGGWITSEHDYPYVSGNGANPACELPKPKVAQIRSYVGIQHDEQQMAAYLVEHGPISICVDASTWQHYTGGIMSDCPSWQVDHCVLIVGYNFEHETPFWIVKNSWAPSWGIEGYVHVKFGDNQCAITSSPINAIV